MLIFFLLPSAREYPSNTTGIVVNVEFSSSKKHKEKLNYVDLHSKKMAWEMITAHSCHKKRTIKPSTTTNNAHNNNFNTVLQ